MWVEVAPPSIKLVCIYLEYIFFFKLISKYLMKEKNLNPINV